MIDIHCGIGSTGNVTPVGQGALDPIIQATKAAIENGSGIPKDIDLTFFSAADSTNSDPNIASVRALDLHRTADAIAPAFSGPVQTIAALFADSYQPRTSLFGLMFDRGVTTPDDPNAGFTDIPRQACVVFPGAIARACGCDDATRDSNADFQREVRKTLIHELGHVFNLGHDDSEPNYMHSDPGADSAFDQFRSDQQRILGLCSASPFVQPGGSKWGDLGPEIDPAWGGDYDAPNVRLEDPSQTIPKNDGRISLTLRLARDRIAFCQPLELDIEISYEGKRGTFARIPDVVDPGYEQFSIWIKRPGGEVARYQPFNRYCRSRVRIDLRPGRHFSRDISVFMSSGGFTFRHVGEHEIWAELCISDERKLVSNVLPLEIVEPSRLFDEGRVETALLRCATGGLFYRSSSPEDPMTKGVAQLFDHSKDPFNRAMSQYALSRILLKSKAHPGVRATLSEHLRELSQHDLLGSHRRHKCSQALDSL